jgi:hypothetical protein
MSSFSDASWAQRLYSAPETAHSRLVRPALHCCRKMRRQQQQCDKHLPTRKWTCKETDGNPQLGRRRHSTRGLGEASRRTSIPAAAEGVWWRGR